MEYMYSNKIFNKGILCFLLGVSRKTSLLKNQPHNPFKKLKALVMR